MARHTGLPADALVTHVLTGLKPIRPRARLTTTQNVCDLPSGEQIVTVQARVAFLAHDVKEKEIRDIYNSIRPHMGGKGTRGLDFRDVEIWRIVQDLGGPPKQHGSKGAFWEKVLDAWNRRHPDERYTSTNWAKKRYQKAARTLQVAAQPPT